MNEAKYVNKVRCGTPKIIVYDENGVFYSIFKVFENYPDPKVEMFFYVKEVKSPKMPLFKLPNKHRTPTKSLYVRILGKKWLVLMVKCLKMNHYKVTIPIS